MFRNIALVGLNGPKFDTNLGDTVSEMIKILNEKKHNIIIDSREGLGEFAVRTITNLKINAKGIYLKPYLSNEFKGEQILKANIGESVIYSNFLERVKQIVKEADLFILFNGGGVYNLSIFSTILALSKMYYGQHKPVVLFGSNWEDVMKFLMQNVGISAQERDILKVATNIDSLLKIIEQYKVEYSNADIQIADVVDRRVEGDEKDFIVSKA